MNKGKLDLGNEIQFKGRVTEFSQKVNSLQIECENVPSVRKGQLAGLKVKKPAKEGDLVYLVKS